MGFNNINKQETRYGIVSDIYDPAVANFLVGTLINEGVDAFIINGGIGHRVPGKSGPSGVRESQSLTNEILKPFAISGLETFFQPGPSETLLGYGPIANEFDKKCSNMHSIDDVLCVDIGDHKLAFLPGSPISETQGGEYRLVSGNGPTGRFAEKKDGNWTPFFSINSYIKGLNSGLLTGRAFQYINSDKLRSIDSIVDEPTDVIAFSHFSPRFNNLEESIDSVSVGEVEENFIYYWEFYKGGGRGLKSQRKDNRYLFVPNGVERVSIPYEVRKGSKIYGSVAFEFQDKGAPISIIEENMGSTDLRRVYDDLGINKHISGACLPESVHNANNRNYAIQDPNLENNYRKNLFFSASNGADGKCAILNVNRDNVKCQKLDAMERIMNS